MYLVLILLVLAFIEFYLSLNFSLSLFFFYVFHVAFVFFLAFFGIFRKYYFLFALKKRGGCPFEIFILCFFSIFVWPLKTPFLKVSSLSYGRPI